MTEVELFRKLKDEFPENYRGKSSRSGWSEKSVPQRFLRRKRSGSRSARITRFSMEAEVMLQAEYKGCIGQAFTSSPAAFSGTLQEILDSDIENDAYARALFIASLNAVMRYLGLADRTIHCKTEVRNCARSNLCRI